MIFLSEEKEDFDKMEETVYGDDDAIVNTDIKINPDFYIHHAIVNAQKSLLHENMKEGFLKYWAFVEHIEILCDSAGMLSDDFMLNIEEFKKTDKYKERKNEFDKQIVLANEKLRLMMGEIFNRKTVTEPLKSRREIRVKNTEEKMRDEYKEKKAEIQNKQNISRVSTDSFNSTVSTDSNDRTLETNETNEVKTQGK